MNVSPCSFPQTPTLWDNDGKLYNFNNRINQITGSEVILHLLFGAQYLISNVSRVFLNERLFSGFLLYLLDIQQSCVFAPEVTNV